MKRALKVLVVLLVVALAALPPLVGRLAEDAFRAQLEREGVADYLDARLVEYDRGWYRSRAVVELRPDSSYVEMARAAAGADAEAGAPGAAERIEEMAGGLTFRLVAELAHGPVGIRRGPFVGLAKGVIHPELEGGEAERWRRRLDVPYLVEIRHRIEFSGASRFDLVAPPIDFERDALAVRLRGWDARVRIDPRSREVDGRAGIETFEVANEETNLQLESLSAEVSGTIAAPSLLLGEGGVRVERFSLIRPLERPARTDMVGFRATGGTEVSEDGDALNSTFTYAVDSLIVDETGVRNAELRMAARNVHRETAERWAAFTREAALSGAEPEPGMLADELRGLVYDFLAAGPALDVDPARFEYDGDPVRARIRVRTDTAALPPRERFDAVAAAGEGFWARLFTAEADVEAAKSLVRRAVTANQESSIRRQLARSGRSAGDAQIEAMARRQADALISGMVESGYVGDEGDRFVSRLRYEDGRLTANGQVLPIPGV